MPRYDVDLRRVAVSLMEGGAGKAALARALAIPPGTAKDWMLTHRAAGAERFIEMGSAHKGYGYEAKLAAARDHVDGGLSRRGVMARHGIASAGCVGSWSKPYREGGGVGLAFNVSKKWDAVQLNLTRGISFRKRGDKTPVD
jgi:transposase-like protein